MDDDMQNDMEDDAVDSADIDLKINDEFRSVLPALSADELKTLEENILQDQGILDPIIYWADGKHNWIVDGMHRFTIAIKHGLSFRTEPMKFRDKKAVVDWIIRHQIGRRNVTEKSLAMYRGTVYKSITEGKSTVKPEVFARSVGVGSQTLEQDKKFAESMSQLPEDVREKILDEQVEISKRDVVSLVSIDPELAVQTIESADKHNIPVKALAEVERVRVSMCEVTGGDHEWISDGNGSQFCAHCNTDLPGPKKIASTTQDQADCKGMLTLIDNIRTRVDRFKNRFLVGDKRWLVILDKLDEARISLASLAREEWE